MSEITGLTLIKDAVNAFPMPEIKRIEDHGLNAVLVNVLEDGSVALSLAITDEKRKQKLIDLANEIMQHGIAPSRMRP